MSCKNSFWLTPPMSTRVGYNVATSYGAEATAYGKGGSGGSYGGESYDVGVYGGSGGAAPSRR